MNENTDTTTPFDFSGQGFRPHEDKGFLGHVGPIWQKVEGERVSLGFQATEKHTNLRGVVHGGMLMTLADRLLGMMGRLHNDNRAQATLQMDAHFFAPARVGDVVIGHSRLMRDTRTLIFIEGDLFVGDKRVLSARGVWKKLGT